MNKGTYLAFATAIISGFAVFFNKFVIGFWQNSSVYATAKNLIVALFLISVILLLKKLPELKRLTKKQWIQLVIIGLIGGSVPFLLFFKALTITSAVNAAFLHKTLFIWVALIAVPLLKEKINALQFIALGILFSGVYLFLLPNKFSMGYGETLAFIATLLWAIENVFAKIILKNISSLAVAWGRMFFGSIFLLSFLLATGNIGGLFMIDTTGIGLLFLTGLLLFGYVITWYSALKHAPATVVSSILVLALPITALLDNRVLIMPTILIILGVLLVSKFYERIRSFRSVRLTA